MKLVLVFSLLLSGCIGFRSATERGLSYAHQAGEAALAAAAPVIDEECRRLVTRCVSEGRNRVEMCPEWSQCNSIRTSIAAAFKGLQYAVLDGTLALAVGDEDAAEKAVARALELLAELRRQLKELGVL
jgi:hypothetical protein